MMHVHGHQDDTDPGNLSPIAKINVHMDELVGQHIENVIASNSDTSEPTLFPSQQVSIVIDKKYAHTHFEDALIFQYYRKPLEKHYRNVIKLDPEEFHNIRWNAIRLTLRDSPKTDQTLKAIHSQWQTKYICKRWKMTQDALCPVCHDADETWEHVLQCNNVHMHRVRNESILKLNQDLSILKTHPYLQKHIIDIVQAWIDKQPIPYINQTNDPTKIKIHHAQIKQENIGYHLMMKGLITKEWGDLQELDYDDNKLPAKYNKIRWEKKLISNLQTMMVNMWAERCKIVHADNIETNDIRYRQKAWEFLCEIKNKKWKISHDCDHLLERDEWFFKSANLLNVQNWYDNIRIAVDRSATKNNGTYRDIRNFFDREVGFLQVRNKIHKLSATTRNEINRLKRTVQQNLSHIFQLDPGLGR